LHNNISTNDLDVFTKGIATLAHKFSEITDANATLIIVKMKNRVYLIGRGHSTRINLLPILTRWEGGGHEQAGSASVKKGDHEEMYKEVEQKLELIIKTDNTARDTMRTPVKNNQQRTTIEVS